MTEQSVPAGRAMPGRGPGAGRLGGFLRRNLDVAGLCVLLVILLAAYRHYDSELFTPASITILSAQFLPLILAAMGQSTVMLAGGIDLSLGSVLALAMAVFAVRAQDGVAIAAVLALAAAASTGAANGVLVAYAGLPPIIVTLAASFLWGGVTLVVLPQPGGSVPAGLVDAYNNGWNGIALPFVVVGAVLLLWKTVRTTRFGLSLYAVGGNEHGAYASGIGTRKVKIGAYGLAGVFVGLAGIGLAIQTGSGDATIGAPYTLNSIAASVLAGVSFFGGVGQMRATVLAALLIGLLTNLLLFTGLSPFYQLIMQGAVLIVAIAVKTFATRERTD
ncbi:ABC transporter permease [Actinomadura sp. 9N215]|uniref:ABC transporter permease n=1 Tax=Actinomadura sp. 9N215 TaxID=3375150 RepID=UPI0037B715F3